MTRALRLMQVFVDIETRSRVDLKKLGVYMYAQDCEVLMAAWSVDGGPVSVDIGEDDIRRRLLGFGDVQFIAHNAGFERVVLGARIDPALQDPARWSCTLALSAEYGYPTALDAVARALGAVPKDTAGKALIRLFTVPRRDGEWNTAETHPERRTRRAASCRCWCAAVTPRMPAGTGACFTYAPSCPTQPLARPTLSKERMSCD